jgi:acetyl-CoA carboxylase biotin carboxyl carrier protein
MADDFALTPEDVAEIVAILQDSKYDKLEVSTLRFRLSVTRSGPGWAQEWNFAAAPESKTGAEAPKGQARTARVSDPNSSAAESDGLIPVKATIPGAFYRSPQPGAPAYVNLGDTVNPNTVVGIMETMKLMSPVLAAIEGVISKIMVENGDVVDAGAVLMLLRPEAR